MANNGQAGIGLLINRKWKDHIVTINNISPRAELDLCIAKRYKLKTVQVYAPTISYSEEVTNSVYNDVDETLGKPSHYRRVTGDFITQIGKRTNPMETDKFGFDLKNEREATPW